MNEIFGNFDYRVHAFFGIGIQPIDLKYVPLFSKCVVAASMALTGLSSVLPPVGWFSDSVYAIAAKLGNAAGESQALAAFLRQQKAGENNLDIVHLVRCPITGGDLTHDPYRHEFVNERFGLAYPIEDNIPILLKDRARKL